MDLLGRKKEIHIHAAPGLQEFMNTYLKTTYGQFGFEVHYHLLPDTESAIFENSHIRVVAFPLKHSAPCCGFLISEKPKQLNVRKSAVEKYQLSVSQILELKDGKDIVTREGQKITNAELTTAPAAPRSYAFITDTLYHEKVIDLIKGVDLLYHEATFAEDLKSRAKATHHATA